ncbi:MAG: flagellar hook-length control protein FliK [Anaerolineales bacterium]
MSLSLQPALPSSPIDGTSAPSRDGGTLQTPSFGEVLKVEEKKLQQEQETAASSIAGLFAKIQQPVLTEIIQGLDASVEVAIEEEHASPALTTDSIQTASSSPQQVTTTLPAEMKVPQRIASRESIAAKLQDRLSMPFIETADAIASDQSPKLVPQVSTPDIEVSEPAKNFATSKDTEQPVTEKVTPPQIRSQVFEANKSKKSTAKVISLTTDNQMVASTNEAEFVQNVSKSETKPKNSTQTAIPVAEIPQPVRTATAITNEKSKTMSVAFEQVASNTTPVEVKPGKSMQAEPPSASLAKEQFRAAPVTSEQATHKAPTFKYQVVESGRVNEAEVNSPSLVKNVNVQFDAVEIETPKDKEPQLVDNPLASMTKTVDLDREDSTVILQVKRTFPKRIDVIADENFQPTNKNAVFAMSEGKDNVDIKSSTVENKKSSQLQENTFVDEPIQPTADQQSPVIKPATPKINNEPVAMKPKMVVSPITETPLHEVVSPVAETVAPSVQPALSETSTAKAVTVELYQGELPQVEEETNSSKVDVKIYEVGDMTVEVQEKTSVPTIAEIPVGKTSHPATVKFAPSIRSIEREFTEEPDQKTNQVKAYTSQSSHLEEKKTVSTVQPVVLEPDNKPVVTNVFENVSPVVEAFASEIALSEKTTKPFSARPAERVPVDEPLAEVPQPEVYSSKLAPLEDDVTVLPAKTNEIDFNSKQVILKEKPVTTFSTFVQPTESKTDNQTLKEVMADAPSVKNTVPASKAIFSTDKFEKPTLDSKTEDPEIKASRVLQVENFVDEDSESELHMSVSNGFAQVESTVEKMEVEVPLPKKDKVGQTVKAAVSHEAPKAEVDSAPGINTQNDRLVFDTIYKPVKLEDSITEDVFTAKETPAPTMTANVSYETLITEPDPSVNIQSDKIVADTTYRPLNAAESITEEVLAKKEANASTLTAVVSHEAPKTETEPSVDAQNNKLVFDTIYRSAMVNIPGAKDSLNAKVVVSDETPNAEVVESTNPPNDDVVLETAPVKKELPTVVSSSPAKDVVAPNARVDMGDQTPKTETVATVNLPSDKPIVETDSLPMALPAKEAVQPESETVISEAKAVLSEDVTKPEAKLTTPVHVEKPIHGASQTVKKPSEQIASTEVSDELFIDENRSVSSGRVVASTRQSSQPVKANDTIATKGSDQLNVTGELRESLKASVVDTEELKEQPSRVIDREMVQQPKVLVTDKLAHAPENTDQQFVEKTNESISPSMSVARDVKVDAKVNIFEVAQPVAMPFMDQVDEVVLKDEYDKVPALLSEDNATAESHLGALNRPKVKNEAFIVEQKNAPVKIRSEVASQSVRVEIDSNEKATSKDTERKPGLDLESTGVAAEVSRGAANVKAVEKSLVKQADPKTIDVVGQITSQMKTHIKSGETSIRMKLNPEELGAIEVQVTRNSQGVSVSFIAEQSSTGQLLESQAGELRQSLKDAGVQLTNLNIGQHHQPNQEGGGFRQSQQFVQTSQRDAPQMKTDEDIQTKQDGLTSEIDYLV